MRRLSTSDSHARDSGLRGSAACTLGATLMAGVVLLTLLAPLPLAHAVKPAPPPPPTPTPPPVAMDLPNIGYVLTWLPNGVVPKEINNVGDVAGTASGAAYAMDGTTAVTVNLNSIGAPWYDLNAVTPNTVSTGWVASTAYGINDAGDIVGTATKKKSKSRVYVLENAFNRDGPRRFLLLPTRSNVDYWAWKINNWGMVVAGETDSDKGVIRYTPQPVWPYYTSSLAIPGTGLSNVDINDYGVIVDRYAAGSAASSWRLIPGAGPDGTDQVDFFSGFEFLSVSNNYISGRSSISGAAGPMRLPELGTSNDVEVIWLNGSSSWSVNDRGDAIFQAVVNGSARSYLYSDEINPSTGEKYGSNGNGILPLDQLIVNGDSDWWNKNTDPRGINNLNVNGFGQLWGAAWPTNNPSYTQGFVLTPIAMP